MARSVISPKFKKQRNEILLGRLHPETVDSTVGVNRTAESPMEFYSTTSLGPKD